MREAQSESALGNDWVDVKMIDFAHTFVQEDEATALLDLNYLEGIEHLVEIFEDLLKTCEWFLTNIFSAAILYQIYIL